MRYSFNHAGPYVEIPELGTFTHEMRNLCKIYHIGFRMESTYGDTPYLQIVPFDRCDWDIFTESLAEYEQGVPFLDEAKLRWQAALQQLAEEEEVRRLERKRKVEEESIQRQMRQETALKEHGIQLSDGHYKLVREEPK